MGVPTKVEAELLPPSNDDLRAQARELYERASSAFFALGRVFYEIKVSEAYLDWGFASYIEYTDAEFGVGARRTQHWIEIWEKFNHQLGYTWEDVGHIGWTKLSRICGVVENRTEAKKWLKKAEKLGKSALEEAVKQERQRRKQETSGGGDQPPARTFTRVDHDVEAELEGVNSTVDAPFVGDPSTIDPAVAVVEELEFEEDGERVPLHKFSVMLYGPQWANLMAAMERAGQLANSDKACHLLDLIATEFNTAYARSEDGGVVHKLEYHVKNLERLYGVKIEVDVPADSALMRMSRLGDEPPDEASPRSRRRAYPR